MRKLSLLSWLYLFVILLLFLYSYTQVDLDLTFSRVPLFHTVIKAFQYIGYFHRPLSAWIYVLLVCILFVFYAVFLKRVKAGRVKRSELWTVIIISGVILVFSYNAFSYDLFNYIFDAKIFTFYHQNPYLHKALDFPHDPMLTFMRWTHRTYPYGPVWLGLTIPLSYLGFQYFIPTFLLFKLLAFGSYLGTGLYVEKIAKRFTKKNSLYALAFFAVNPLVIIESIVSAHIDIVMIFLFIWSVYLLLSKKYIRSLFLLLLSIGVKYVSVLLIPVFIYLYFLHKRKDIPINRTLFLCLLAMVVGILAQTQSQGNFQPWYLLVAMPFAAFLGDSFTDLVFVFCLTFASLMEYTAYLYLGNWDPPVPSILRSLTIGGVVLPALLVVIKKLLRLGKKE